MNLPQLHSLKEKIAQCRVALSKMRSSEFWITEQHDRTVFETTKVISGLFDASKDVNEEMELIFIQSGEDATKRYLKVLGTIVNSEIESSLREVMISFPEETKDLSPEQKLAFIGAKAMLLNMEIKSGARTYKGVAKVETNPRARNSDELVKVTPAPEHYDETNRDILMDSDVELHYVSVCYSLWTSVANNYNKIAPVSDEPMPVDPEQFKSIPEAVVFAIETGIVSDLLSRYKKIEAAKILATLTNKNSDVIDKLLTQPQWSNPPQDKEKYKAWKKNNPYTSSSVAETIYRMKQLGFTEKANSLQSVYDTLVQTSKDFKSK